MSNVAPGLYRDMPFAEYQSIPAINSGVVRWGHKATMLHMDAARRGAIANTDTEDRKFGRAVHCRLLEPERYRKEFLIATTCVGQTARGKVCGNRAKFLDGGRWYCGTHAHDDAQQPTDYIDTDESARNERIAEKLHTHKVMNLLKREGWSEVSCVWEQFGLPMKCRLDRLSAPRHDVIIDLKKVKVGKIRREHCEKAIADHRYDMQASMYAKAIEELDGVTPRFWWVFIEDNEPFDVQAFPADQETLDIGWFDVQRTLQLYASQKRQNDLRGAIYDPNIIRPGGLPGRFRIPYRELGASAADDSDAVVAF